MACYSSILLHSTFIHCIESYDTDELRLNNHKTRPRSKNPHSQSDNKGPQVEEVHVETRTYRLKADRGADNKYWSRMAIACMIQSKDVGGQLTNASTLRSRTGTSSIQVYGDNRPALAKALPNQRQGKSSLGGLVDVDSLKDLSGPSKPGYGAVKESELI